MDYIKRIAAELTLHELREANLRGKNYEQYNKAIDHALIEIEGLPAADVEERNVEKWEIIDEVEPRRYGCSNCKRMVWHIENFCPNCGAKMEGNE